MSLHYDELDGVDMSGMMMNDTPREALQRQLASMAETSDGWMQAYYRQTSRLLAAEATLRDIVRLSDDEAERQRKRPAGRMLTVARINSVAASTLEEIKE